MISRSVSLVGAAAGVCVATLISTVVYIQLRKRFRKRYVKVGKVSKLFFYPFKAFAAQEVPTAEFTKMGVRVGKLLDRMWTVVDEKGHCIDQKLMPRYVLLHAHQEDGRMHIDGPSMDTLKLEVLDKIDDQSKVVRCHAFNRDIDAVDCGEEAAKWIQKFSGQSGLRLVQYVSSSKPRPADMRGLCKLKGEDFPVIFQADQHVLILSEASIEDLNSRIEEKITCLNFRPNILVERCKAFDEDKWKCLKIGETATLVKTVASGKCVRTTVNTTTGVCKGLEPLAMLRKYRLATTPEEKSSFKYTPLFGMYYAVETEGRVSVGDDVYAIYE